MSGIDRTQNLNIDCPQCHGNSYVTVNGVQETCPRCEGLGMLQKEVPYRFESQGKWSREDIAQEFEVSVDDVKDGSHSSGD